MCIYYVYWCVTRFPYRVMFMSLNRDTTGATSGAGIAYPIGAPELPKMFFAVRVDQSLISPFHFVHPIVCPSSIYD